MYKNLQEQHISQLFLCLRKYQLLAKLGICRRESANSLAYFNLLVISTDYQKISDGIFKTGLHKLWNPAIPYGVAWSKHREHGDMENMENIKQMTTYDSSQSTQFVNQMSQNTLFYVCWREGVKMVFFLKNITF